MQNKLAVVIIVFNISHLIEKQIQLVRKFCKDDHDIIVIDNSSNLQIASVIESKVKHAGVSYIKTSSPPDFSQSHATACNLAYHSFKDVYKYLFLLDHDNFPITKFSVMDVMKDKVIGGVGQARGNILYYWPGCTMINNEFIDKALVDFSVNYDLGLDTGGNLYKIIEKHGTDKCVNFDQYDIPNPADKSYSFYNEITNPKSISSEFRFMHFINSSNWNKKERNEERVQSLLQILEQKVSG